MGVCHPYSIIETRFHACSIISHNHQTEGNRTYANNVYVFELFHHEWDSNPYYSLKLKLPLINCLLVLTYYGFLMRQLRNKELHRRQPHLLVLLYVLNVHLKQWYMSKFGGDRQFCNVISAVSTHDPTFGRYHHV
jgi:hypothetical protein